MFNLKTLVLVLLLAAVAVAGYNYGRGEALWANPFKKTVEQQFRSLF